MKFGVAILLVALVVACQASVPEDEITMMPGMMKQPPFKQYSGYLKASGTKKLHYWFVESMGNPMKDPVVLWLNGGPGCSSDLGLLTENGPFRIKPDGKTPYLWEYSWSTVANMLFLEAPAGVGFSYSDDKNYTTDDNEVAQDNYLALKDFFSKYKDFSKLEFFITGESYGGIYVPTLSSLVVDDPDINFQGMGIGNGLSNYRYNDNSLIYFAFTHGLIGEKNWMDLNKFCCPANSSSLRCYFTDMMNDQNCNTAVNKAMNIVYAGGLNIYNLYGECAGGVLTHHVDGTNMTHTSNFGYPLGMLDIVLKDRWRMQTIATENLRVDPPCVSAKNVAMYLNSDAVRTALHIPSVVQEWTSCSSDVGNTYKKIYQEMSKQYKKVLNAGKRVLVYNGDIDMACNFLGDEWFVDDLGLASKGDRAEWYYKAADGTKQVAGFVKTFQNLSLVTVKGAGHMVPTDKPIPGLLMFTSFIQNQALP